MTVGRLNSLAACEAVLPSVAWLGFGMEVFCQRDFLVIRSEKLNRLQSFTTDVGANALRYDEIADYSQVLQCLRMRVLIKFIANRCSFGQAGGIFLTNRAINLEFDFM